MFALPKKAQSDLETATFTPNCERVLALVYPVTLLRCVLSSKSEGVIMGSKPSPEVAFA